jgi:WhiB family transcriptional regulator, redox-sensing transcriptional regulator
MSARSALEFSPGAAGPALREMRNLSRIGRPACADEEPDLFFATEMPAAISAAKAICSRCPVRPGCLEYAVITDQEYGTWAGLSEAELRPLRHAHAAELLKAGRKRCGECGDVKPLGGFARHGWAADGYQRECDDCLAAQREDGRTDLKAA